MLKSTGRSSVPFGPKRSFAALPSAAGRQYNRAMFPTAASRCLWISLIGFFLFGSSSLAQKPGSAFVPGEILVKMRKGVSKRASNDLLSRLGASRREDLGDLGWVRVRVRRGQDPRAAAAEMMRDPDVEAAQPNFYYKLTATPNDPQWSSSNLYGLRAISAPAAWDTTTGSSSVVVANIDTGMRYSHEDLAANMWTNPGEVQGNGVDDDGNGFADDYYGYDFFYNDPDPLDQHGHGTHTGGTIGAVGNNAVGIAGVSWSVKVMAVKIFSPTGQGTTTAMLINAYNYVRMMKLRGVNIRVTNNSYSGADEADNYDQATRDAIDAMGEAGILNVFAAGNNAANNDTAVIPNYPASYTSPSVLAVAASTSTDARASFSAYGANSVDIAAPGTLVLSTTNGSDQSYGLSSGTSMAAPHATGAAALLAAFNPALSPASIKATLLNTADTFASLGPAVEQGWANTPVRSGGRLNVARALLNQTVCEFDISTRVIHARTKGGYHTIGISSAPNCDFSIKSGASWIWVDGPDADAGGAQIRFRVAASPFLKRSAVLSVAGQPVSVNQGRVAAF